MRKLNVSLIFSCLVMVISTLLGVALTMAQSTTGGSNLSDNNQSVYLMVSRDMVMEVREFLQKHPDSNENQGDLIFAATSVKMLKLLAESGFDLKAKGNFNASLLQVAAQNGETEIVAYLLSQGHCVNRKDRFGNSALYYACGNIKAKNVEILIKNGAFLDIQNSNGETPLMESLKNGHTEAFQLLLASGADPYIEDSNGRTLRDLFDVDMSSFVSKEDIELMKDIYMGSR